MPINLPDANHFHLHANGNEGRLADPMREGVRHTAYPALHQDGRNVAATDVQRSGAIQHDPASWLDIYEAGRKIRMSSTTVRELIRGRKIAAYRIRNRYWIRPEDIEAFLSSVYTPAK